VTAGGTPFRIIVFTNAHGWIVPLRHVIAEGQVLLLRVPDPFGLKRGGVFGSLHIIVTKVIQSYKRDPLFPIQSSQFGGLCTCNFFESNTTCVCPGIRFSVGCYVNTLGL
jgi:hypothetical protein